MSRKINVLLGLSLAVACIVALVRAQDVSQRWAGSMSADSPPSESEAVEPRALSADDRDPTRRGTDVARRLRSIRDTRGSSPIVESPIVETSPVQTPTPATPIAPSSRRYSDEDPIGVTDEPRESTNQANGTTQVESQDSVPSRWASPPIGASPVAAQPFSAPPAGAAPAGSADSATPYDLGPRPAPPPVSGALPSVLKRGSSTANTPDAREESSPARLPDATGRPAIVPNPYSAVEPYSPPDLEPRPAPVIEQNPQPVIEHVPASGIDRRSPAVIDRAAHDVGGTSNEAGSTLRSASSTLRDTGETSHDESTSSRRTLRSPSEYEATTIAPRSQALVSSQIPALRVETIGRPAVSIGKESVYTVRLVNEGNASAENVTVTVRLPSWIEVAGAHPDRGEARPSRASGEENQTQWSIPSVARRSEVSLSLRLIPRSDRPFELAVDVAARPSTSFTQVEVKVPRLDVQISGPSDVLYGEVCLYQVTLSNPGTGDAENVMLHVHHDTPSGPTHPGTRIGTIAAGEKKQLQLEFTPDAAGATQIRAEAQADADLTAETRHDVFVRRAVLEVYADGPPLAFAGAPVEFEIEVANTGTAPAENAVLTVTLPVGSQYLGGVDGAKEAGGVLTLPLGNLPPQSRRAYQISCSTSTSGDARLEVAVEASRKASASATAVTRVEAVAELKLDMDEPRGPQSVGTDTQYVVRIKNRGTKAARQIQVVVQFSEGVEPVLAQGAKAELVPGQAVFQPLVNLGAGEEIALTVKARADRSGNHLFRTEVRCIEPETRLVFEGTTRFYGDVSASGTTASKGGGLRR